MSSLLELPFRQFSIVIVPFVLHPGRQGDHGQVMGIDDVVDVSGEPEREFRHGDEKGFPSPCSRSLHIHGRTAGRLTETAPDILPPFAESFDQAHARRRFSFSEGGRGDRGYLDILSVWPFLQTLHDLDVIELAQFPHGDNFFRLKAELVPPLVHRGHIFFRDVRNLPICEFSWICLHILLRDVETHVNSPSFSKLFKVLFLNTHYIFELMHYRYIIINNIYSAHVPDGGDHCPDNQREDDLRE